MEARAEDWHMKPKAKVDKLLELGGLNGRESEPSVVGSTPTHPAPDGMGPSSQISVRAVTSEARVVFHHIPSV